MLGCNDENKNKNKNGNEDYIINER